MEGLIFRGVGRYSLVKTYVRSYNCFCIMHRKTLAKIESQLSKRQKLISTSDLGAPLLG